jgi:pyruvate dehydrogenase E2 component (dihydrolipoamide acetyltransferase)
MASFDMPSLGADMESGTLVEWLVKPGDTVKRGDVVAVVETDKGAIDVEIWEGGRIGRLLVPPGTKVPVGTPLAMLESGTSEPAPLPPPVPPAVPPSPQPPPVTATPGTGTGEHVRASPAARRRAHELGIDLHELPLPGSGPSGAFTLADVERSVHPEVVAQPPAAEAPALLPDMRRAIALAMTRAKREIPHYYLESTIDLGAALAWLANENRLRDVAERILPVALLLRAVVRAATEVPEMNGHFTEPGFIASPSVHLGVAISLRAGRGRTAGLVAPAIRDADRLSLAELQRALGDVIQRARAGRLRSS